MKHYFTTLNRQSLAPPGVRRAQNEEKEPVSDSLQDVQQDTATSNRYNRRLSRSLLTILTPLLGLLWFSQTANAQVVHPLTGTYSQDFSSLGIIPPSPSSPIPLSGHAIMYSQIGGPPLTGTNHSTPVNLGLLPSSGVFRVTEPSLLDRSFGIRSGGSSPVAYMGLQFRNDDPFGRTIKCFKIKHKTKTFTFRSPDPHTGYVLQARFLNTGTTPLADLAGPGNWVPFQKGSLYSGVQVIKPCNTGTESAFSTPSVEAKDEWVSGPAVNIAPGEHFTIRWEDINDGTCDRPFITLDDFEITPLYHVEPSILANIPACNSTNITWDYPVPDRTYITGYKIKTAKADSVYTEIIVNSPNILTATIPNLLPSTQYRTKIYPIGPCNDIYREIVYTTAPPPGPGTITGPSSTCINNSITLQNAAGPGTVTWEKSNDLLCLTGFIPTGFSGNTYNTPPVSSSACFRTYVTNPQGCVSAYTTKLVTVLPHDAGNAAFTCNPPLLTLTGHNGNIQWELSSACDGNFSAIPSQTLATFNPIVLSGSQCFRALLYVPNCAPKYSNIVRVFQPPVAGTITGLSTVCQGARVSLSNSNAIGDVSWEVSHTGCAGPFNSTGFNGNTYLTEPVNTLTCYRTIVKNGSCAQVSTPFPITVLPVSAGTAAPSPACQFPTQRIELTGYSGNIQWQEDPSCGNFANPVDLTGETSQTLLVNVSSGSRCFRAMVTETGGCPPQFSNGVRLYEAPVGGTISGPTSICPNANLSLTLTGNSGGNVLWEKSAGSCGSFFSSNVIGTTYTTNLLVSPYCYRAKVTSPSGCVAYSNDFLVDVPNIAVGTVSITPNVPQCGTGTFTLTNSGAIGSLDWQVQNNCAGAFTSTGLNVNNPPAQVLTTTKCFRLVVSSNGCTKESQVLRAEVSPAPIAGNVRADRNSVCQNDPNPLEISLVTSRGDIQWEKDVNCANSFTTISGANNPVLTVSNLTTTTCFRAKVSTACSTATSSVVTINVIPGLNIPTIAASGAPVCQGGTLNFNVSNPQNGVNYTWSDLPVGSFISVGQGTSAITLVTGSALPGTYNIKVTPTNPNCGAGQGNTLAFTIDSLSRGGLLTTLPSNSYCANSNVTTSIILSGQVGNVVRWESSNDNFLTVNPPINTISNTLTVNSLTRTTSYRAVVKKGGCAEVYSPVSTITVYPEVVGGQLSPSVLTECALNGQGLFNLVGHQGNVIRWESSPVQDFSSGVQTINNTQFFLFITNVTTTTYYRAVVSSQRCPNLGFSQPSKFEITPASVGGNLSSNDLTVCSGNNSGTITLGNNTGSVLYWESSTTNFASVTPIQNPSSTLTFNNLVQNTKFRAVVKNGICPGVFSDIIEITVRPGGQFGTVLSSATACNGQNAGTLALVGASGNVLRWESSTSPNFANINSISNTSSTLEYANLTETTYYRAIVENANCGSGASAVASITIIAQGAGGTASANPNTVCIGATAQVQVTGHSGNVLRWERSELNCNGPWTPINSSVETITTSGLANATCFRAVISNNNCSQVFSAPALVNTTTVRIDNIQKTDVTCRGRNDGVIEVTASGANNIEYAVYPANSTPTFGAANRVSNLANGIYFVSVRDAGNPSCASPVEVITITQPVSNLAIVDVITTNASCSNGALGSINISVEGGSGNYSFAWSNGATTEDVENLQIGTYSVTVTDINGNCSDSRSAIAITGGTAISITGTATNANCSGSADGSISITVSGGFGSKSFVWSDGSTDEDRMNIRSGTYTVVVTDQNNCRAEKTFVVNENSTTVLSFTSTDVPCQNNLTGSITVSAFGGTPPFSFVWSNQATTNNASQSTISNLAAGDYSVTVTDANGCTKIGTRRVNATSGPEAPTVTASQNTICLGNAVALTATSNANAPIYQWFSTIDAQIADLGTGATINVTPNSVGTKTYYVQVISNNNFSCASARTAVMITVVAPVNPPVINASNNLLCAGQSTNISAGNFNGVILRWESSINNFQTATNLNLTSSTISTGALSQTTQYRVVTGGNCEVTSDPITVQVSPNVVAGSLGNNRTLCNGGSPIRIDLSGSTGSIVRWESSENNFVNITTLNIQANSFDVTTLANPTQYRAIVGNPNNVNCPTQTTASITVTPQNCGQITVSEANLAFGTVRQACANPVKTYMVSGTQLTNSVLINVGGSYEISLNQNTGYSSNLSLSPNNQSLASTPVFVRLVQGAANGSQSANITHTSTGATSQTVALNATVTTNVQPQLLANTAVVAFGQVVTGSSSVKSYTLSGNDLTQGNVNVVVGGAFEISRNQNGPFSQALTIAVNECSLSNTEIFVRFTPTTVGTFSNPVLHSNLNTTLDITATGRGVTVVETADVVSNSAWNSQQDVDNTFGAGVYTYGVNAFSGLQAAVANTPDGKTLMLVGENHYSNSTVLDAPINIIGDGEATIKPLGSIANNYAGDNPEDALNSAFSSRHAFIIKSDDVTIKNIKIDGGSDATCEQRFGVGIITDNRTNEVYDNITIEDVEINHVYSRGVQLLNTGSDNVITNTTVNDVCQRFNPNPLIAAEAAGIYINRPSIIDNNKITNAGTGIIADNLGANGITQISQNEVQYVTEDGIRVDTRNDNTSQVQVSANRISNIGDAGIEARGLGIGTVIGGANGNDGNQILINSTNPNNPGIGLRVSNSEGARVQNNTVIASGDESGMHLLANTNLGNQIIVQANTINRTGTIPTVEPAMGLNAGVFMSDNGAFLDGANQPSYATFYGNEINGFYINFFTNGNGIDGEVTATIGGDFDGGSNSLSNAHEGIRINGRSRVRVGNNARSITNSDIGIRVYGGDAEIIGNSFRDNKVAIQIDDKPGFSGLAIIKDNLFDNNVMNIVNNSQQVTNIVDASWNWMGTTDISTVRNKIKGNVDYSPFYSTNQDIDNNLDNGYIGIRTNVYVDALSAKTNGEGQIQDAINEPLTQTINVVDGLYDETTTVSRNITLTNDGQGFNPIIVNLTMAGSNALLRLNESFDITGTLRLQSGNINVANAKVLTVLRGGEATAGNENSYVIGSLARQSASTSATELYYPIGTTTAFRPAALTVAQNSNILNSYIGMVVQPNNFVRSAPASISSVSNVRVHNFRKVGSANITSGSVKLAFGSDEAQNDNAIVKDEDGMGSTWTDLGGMTSNMMVSSTNSFTSLGNFALAVKTGNNNGGGGSTTVTPSEIVEISGITINTAFVRWTVPNCANVRYEFRYRVTGEQNWTTAQGLNNSFFMMVGLQPATRYEVSVRSACGTDAFSNWSTTVLNNFTTLTASTSCDGPSAPIPGGFFVSNVNATTAVLNWNLTTNAIPQGTIIAYGPINITPSAWAQVVVCHPVNSYQVTGLQGNKIYGVRIRTNCSNCTTALNSNDKRSAWTTIATFTTTSFKEMETSIASQNINVYPNPNKGNFVIAFNAEANETVQIKVTDLAGKVYYNTPSTTVSGENQVNVSLENYTAGVYILEFKQGDTVKHVKLIVE